MRCPTCGRELPEEQGYCPMCLPEGWVDGFENQKGISMWGKENRGEAWEQEWEPLPERPENSNGDVMLWGNLELPEQHKQPGQTAEKVPLAHPTPMEPEEAAVPAVQEEAGSVPEAVAAAEPVEQPVPVDQPNNIPPAPEEPGKGVRSMSGRKWAIAVAGVVLLCAVGTAVGWNMGGRQMQGEYEKKLDTLNEELTAAKEETAQVQTELDELQAERDELERQREALLETKETLTKVSGLLAGGALEEALGQLGSDQSQLLEELRTEIYTQGEASYKSGALDQAERCFGALNGWSRSADYLSLIGLERGGVDKSDYNQLVELLGIGNASALLFSDKDMSFTFLEGEWRTDTLDDYYFKMVQNDEGGHTASYNLPSFSEEGYFYLTDGIYSVGAQEESAVDYYRFNATGENDLEIYCYKDGQTYTLHRV